ncbi:MAG TPA: hypothetical protein VM925_22680 [Labilithrix sp.]|nr:hypothetical protein [Labilithrix sp.]
MVAVDVERKSSVVVLARIGPETMRARTIAFVADADAQEIVTFDLDRGSVEGRTSVGGSPSHLLLTTASGVGRLYVTARDANVVKVFDVGAEPGRFKTAPTLRLIAEMPTATEPVAMATTHDGATLLVVSGWGHSVEGFSTRTRTRVFSTVIPREPRAVVADRTGAKAFVAHALGSGLTVVDIADAGHSPRSIPLEGKDGILDEIRDGTAERARVRCGRCFHGLFSFGDEPPPRPPKAAERRLATQGFAISAIPFGPSERILVPETLVRPRAPSESNASTKLMPRPTGYGFSGGEAPTFGPASGHIAAVYAASEATVPTSMVLTVRDTSCLLPRAAALDFERRSLLVACLGTNEVDEYDAYAESPAVALRGRWKVPAGPTGLAVDKDQFVVWSSFDRVLTVIGRNGSLQHLSTTKERAPTPFEVGRKLFHASMNRAISSDGRACASCHPDGRDDGLTWTSPDGPRQTPMLAGRLEESAPFGWTNASSTVRKHLTETLRRLEGTGLTNMEMYALLTYLARMKKPYRTSPSDRAMLARGEAIFHSYEAGCSACHVGTDGKPIGDGDTHDIESAVRGDLTRSFATPSLQFVGGTAPYFHDGRYATLGELLRATDGKMGNTGHLGPADIDALTTYLESL